MKSSTDYVELIGLATALQNNINIPDEVRAWIQQRIKELEKK